MAKKGGMLRTVYGVFFALLTLFVGGLFVVQVWSIFRSAPQSPYTTENIAKHFKEIALPVWVWLGGLVLSILLAYLFPEGKARVKSKPDEKKVLERVKKKVPTEGEYFDKAYALSKRSRTLRLCVGIVTALFVLTAIVLCALTLLGVYYQPIIKASFFAKQRGLVDKIVQTAVLSIGGLILCCIAAGIFALSRKREQKGYLDIIAESKRPPVEKVEEQESLPIEEETEKSAPLEEVVAKTEEKQPSRWTNVIHKIAGKLFLGESTTQAEIDEEIAKVIAKGTAPVQQDAQEVVLPVQIVEEPLQEECVVEEEKKKKPLLKEKKERKAHPKAKKAGLLCLRIGLAATGVALIALGVYNGGMKDVLLKAINICTQCIGLG